jgi:hypothetical protein
MPNEVWKIIPSFPDYQVSSLGRVYNDRLGLMMRVSINNHGHKKISLRRGPFRYTRSVAVLVAEAFVSPPNALCNRVVVLDGDFFNVKAENLVWRPAWFAWKYTHQLKTPQPIHYHNLSVRNISKNIEYPSIIEAGMREGLLFKDIWRSTFRHESIFPNGDVFEITERV